MPTLPARHGLIRHPQANGLVESVHLTVAETLPTTIFAEENWQGELDQTVQACAFAVRAAVPSIFPYSPGQLVFGRDMMFNLGS